MHRPLDVSVLEQDAVDAYAWPSGQIYLTCGLVDLLDDDELVAAIAHEAGHLIESGHLRELAHPAALAGNRNVEAAADARGAVLLVDAGLSPSTMARMLTTVSEAVGPQTTRGRAISQRASHIVRSTLRAARPTADR